MLFIFLGEKEYSQRIDDIRLLKTEIKRLRQEKSLLTKAVLNTTDLQLEVFNLERDLTRERLKCRALEEEVQNPLNIHRWRKLEGSDPSTMELIQKIQILQRYLRSRLQCYANSLVAGFFFFKFPLFSLVFFIVNHFIVLKLNSTF